MSVLTGPRTAVLRVLVIDDHRVFTELLGMALDGIGDVECVAWATTLAGGLAKAAAYPVDAAIVDVQLPDGSGIEAIAALRALHPACRVIMLTAHPRAALAEQALAAGAVAFLAKDGRLEEVVRALRTATAAHPVVTRELRAERTRVPRLTPREQDVLARMGDGLTAARIASDLVLSQHTVRGHIKAILAKLGAQSQLDAVTRAIGLGLLGPRRP